MKQPDGVRTSLIRSLETLRRGTTVLVAISYLFAGQIKPWSAWLLSLSSFTLAEQTMRFGTSKMLFDMLYAGNLGCCCRQVQFGELHL
jgi:hypothetical protein